MRAPVITNRLTFVLRLWQARDASGSTWHASLEPLGMGPRLDFAAVPELFAYLTAWIEGQADPASRQLRALEPGLPGAGQPVERTESDARAANGDMRIPQPPFLYDALSSREEEILGLISKGRTNKQIAHELSLSIRTVERYRSSIMRKAGLQNRAELVAYAVLLELLSSTAPR